MRIISTLFMMAFCLTTNMQAQEYNMFNAADCDAEGWLWLDTQAKVDKYVGLIDEANEAVKTDGKLIQMAYANVAPDFPATTVDPNIMGYGTDGVLDTVGSLKGAIILPPSTQVQTYNGGAVVICMPSCATFSVCVSSAGKVYMQQKASTNTDITNFPLVVASSVFNPFARAGVTKVTGLENKTNGSTGNTFKSDAPKYAMLRNGTSDTIFIHGFKITTPKAEPTGIKETIVQPIKSNVYTIDGTLVASQVNDAQLNVLKKGVYIVRKGKDVKKVTVK